MDDEFIDYGKLIDSAMHVIVRRALEKVCEKGLPGKHHFFISFMTGYPGVKLSKALLDKYPEEMTVVLQHQFEELTVTDKGFSVVLSFDNVREKVVVPFDALVAFADPSVKFGLQFRHMDEYDEDELAEIREFALYDEVDLGGEDEPIEDDGKKKGKGRKSKKTNVVDIDTFRKK